MISLAFSLGLWVLAFVNKRIGRSLMYPPAAFAAIWAALLLGLAISGDLFFSVSITTLCIYLVGALSFSAGGLYCMKRMKLSQKTGRAMCHSHQSVIRLVLASSLLLVVCFPLYWRYLERLSMASGYSNPWIAIRAKSVALSDKQWTESDVDWESVVFNNVLTVATVIALVGVAEEGLRRRERLIVNSMVLMALLYSSLMASSAGAASLLGAILGIKSIKKGQVRASVAALTLVGFVVLFVIVAVVLGKGRTNPSASMAENVAPAVEIVEWYTLGGVVAFDRVVQNPSGMRSSWSISRFFLLTANKLGASFEVPSLHAEYTAISPSMKTNVYTMYFSYFQDYGWAGIVVLPYVLGYALTWAYRRARDGSREALVLYGLTFSGVLLSGFNEEFFLALNTLLKAMVVVWCVFTIPRWWRSNRNLQLLGESRVPSFRPST